MRSIPIVAILAALSACVSQGGSAYMVENKTDPVTGKWVERKLSPYFELEQANEDAGLTARLVITLGTERVPKGFVHVGPFAADLSRAYRDGITEWASEIYFINTSKQAITVEPISLRVGTKEKTFSGSFTVEPGTWRITAPLIELSSSYGTQANAQFEYRANGKLSTVAGVAKRMTVEEVAKKYTPKKA